MQHSTRPSRGAGIVGHCGQMSASNGFRHGTCVYLNMRLALAWLFILLVSSCGKEEMEGPSSVTGTWRYATPNGKISVTFDLEEQMNGGLIVSNLAFELDGQIYQSAHQIEEVDLPLIGRLRFNANDSRAVYPYFIEFEDCSVNLDFNVINVISGSYSYPWGTINQFDDVQILRVE